MTTIFHNLQSVREKIASAAQQCNRDPKDIQLIAVSKTKPISAIEEAIAAKQYQFGENYVQEGVEKITHFKQKSLAHPIEWHFIGSLQANKTRLVAENFDWVHTVDRMRIAQRLAEQRPAHLHPLNVLIEVNISNQTSKSGISLSELSELAQHISAFPQLTLRGLMAIPAPQTEFEQQKATFLKMMHAFTTLKNTYPHLDTLSMGMTDDMVAAIFAGSTMVRIGTAIFGARNYNSMTVKN